MKTETEAKASVGMFYTLRTSIKLDELRTELRTFIYTDTAFN